MMMYNATCCSDAIVVTMVNIIVVTMIIVIVAIIITNIIMSIARRANRDQTGTPALTRCHPRLGVASDGKRRGGKLW